MITRDAPWRTELNVPYEFWRDTITSARNPNGTGERADPELASDAAWKMAQPLSALCLAMLKAESSYGTDFQANPRSNKNPLNLKLPQGGGYVSNLTWIGGIQSWRQRITSPTYKDGIYADTESIADLIHVFAPTSENETEQYINGVVQRMNAYPIAVETPSTPEEPMASPLKITRQMIPNGNGNRPGSKLNQAPLWITIHETANTSRGAGAKMHADFVRNGGGSEGVSFHATVDDKEAYQMLPADEVGYHAGDGCNSRADDIGCFQSFAIETCVNSDSNWATTKNNLVELVAAIITGDPRIDFAGRKGQFSVDRIAQHNKWSGKHCPAKIRNEGSWNALLAQIRARVAELEGGTTPAPDPEPDPTEPEIVPGVDWGIAKRAFDNPDPALADYKLTKGGPLSTAYIERAKQTGKWPQLVERWPYENGARVYYKFSDGSLALFTDADKKIRWIEGVTV